MVHMLSVCDFGCYHWICPDRHPSLKAASCNIQSQHAESKAYLPDAARALTGAGGDEHAGVGRQHARAPGHHQGHRVL